MSAAFFDYVDKLIPPWVAPRTLTIGESSGLTPEGEDCGPRSATAFDENGVPREYNMPFFRYVRAVDPAGNICALIVAPTRNGDPASDFGGYEVMIRKAKIAKGWLIAERGEEYKGMDDDQYGAFLAKKVKDRQAAYLQLQKKQEEEHESLVMKAQKQQSASIASAIANSMGGGANATIAALEDRIKQLEGKGGKRA